VSTEKYNFCLLRYNETSELVETLATGSLRDKCCRPSDSGQLAAIDADGRLLVLHIFQGLLKVLPVDGKQRDREGEVRFRDPYNLRLDELQVHSIALMEQDQAAGKVMLTVLHETVLGRREVVSHGIETDKRLSEGPFRFEVDERSHTLIAVPKPRGGLLILADGCVQYFKAASANGGKADTKLSVSFSGTAKIVAHTRIDADGFRYLLGDQRGALMLLVLQSEGSSRSGSIVVSGLKLETLGRTSVPATLEYLDEGRVFVGSRWGPNQLVQMSSVRGSDGTFLHQLSSRDTLSPILDMCLVDADRTGTPDTLVACSGAFSSGGLSIVRRGVGADAWGSFCLGEDQQQQQPLTSVWPLDLLGSGVTDHVALVTATGTELLRLDLAQQAVDFVGAHQQQLILSNVQSLFLGQIGAMVLQVTSKSFNYKSCLPSGVRRIWMPPTGISILAACLHPDEPGLLLLALSNSYLVLFYLNETGSELVQKRTVLLPGLPSAIALGRVQGHLFAFAGVWSHGRDDQDIDEDISDSPFGLVAADMGLDLPIVMHLAALKEVPRSLACISFPNTNPTSPFLFAALPTGALFYSALEYRTDGLTINGKRESLLGSGPAQLIPLENGSLFLLSDRPCVVAGPAAGSGHQPHFLAVPLPDLRLWCPLRLGSAPGRISFLAAMGANGELQLGSLDASQARTRLHVHRIPVGETLRRIVHLPALNLFAVLALRPATDMGAALSVEDMSSLCLYSDRTFELLDRYALPGREAAQCLALVSLPGGAENSLVVGTAVGDSNSSGTGFQSPKGHLLTFRIEPVHDAGRRTLRLRLISSHFLPGCVYSLAQSRQDQQNGLLLATVNGSTCVFRWDEGGREAKWREVTQHHGQIVGVHMDAGQDGLVAVGDMMRSASLLQISPEGDKLTEVARDYYTGWCTQTRLVDGKHILVADDHGNLSQLVVTADPNFLTERLVLDHSSAFHLGSIINSLVPGNLAEPGSNSSATTLLGQSFLFGTACGTLGSLATIPDPALYTCLLALQQNILAVSRAAGLFNHSEWRSFYNEKRAMVGHAHFIDGDVIQRFQALPEALQKAVVTGEAHHCTRLPGQYALRDILELVDRLAAH